MPEQETITKGAPAGTGDGTSPSGTPDAGTDSSKTTTPVVENGGVEDKSKAGDAADGAANDGVRRPGRAERRISELTKRNKELETGLEERNVLLRKLSESPVDQSKIDMPDYSKVDTVTPDLLKSDILKAANQIVDQKMDVLGNMLIDRVEQRDVSARSDDAIAATIAKFPKLNPNSEEYDEELDDEIADSWNEAKKNNPTYSFTSFIKPYERLLGQSSTTGTDNGATSKTESSRGTSANRSTAPVRRSNDFPETGTAAEMEAWFAKNRG